MYLKVPSATLRYHSLFAVDLLNAYTILFLFYFVNSFYLYWPSQIKVSLCVYLDSTYARIYERVGVNYIYILHHFFLFFILIFGLFFLYFTNTGFNFQNFKKEKHFYLLFSPSFLFVSFIQTDSYSIMHHSWSLEQIEFEKSRKHMHTELCLCL